MKKRTLSLQTKSSQFHLFGDTKEAIYELKVKRDYFIVVVNRKVA